MFQSNIQPKLLADSEDIRKKTCDYLVNLMEVINGCVDNAKPDTLSRCYGVQAVNISWGIFYANCFWLINNFCRMDVPFWPIAMAKRLLLETVADLQYMQPPKRSKEVDAFFSQIKKAGSVEKYIEGMKKTEHGKEFRAFSCPTMKRIEKVFGTYGVQQYNILSTFEHVNNEGTLIALGSSRLFDKVRKSVVHDIPLLLETITDVIASDGSFAEVSTIKDKMLDDIKESFEKYKKNGCCF